MCGYRNTGKHIIILGLDFSSIVGDARVIASEVMSLKMMGFHILYLAPSNSVNFMKGQVTLKSDSLAVVLKYFKITSEYTHQIIEKLCTSCNPELILIGIRSVGLVGKLVKKFVLQKQRIVTLVDNLRYINPARIYNCTGSLSEMLKCVSGFVYYNLLPLTSTYSIAVSKRCRDVLLFKDKILTLPPCYVEIYPENGKNCTNHEVTRQRLQIIKDFKDEGYTIVLHAKIFRPSSGKSFRAWYKTLGFYSFMSFYIMARYLRECIVVTWDVTPQLLDFYTRSFNLPRLPNNAIWLPYISQEYINELYELVDIVVIPRLGWHGYGVTTSLIEALYFSKPILTTSNVLESLGLDKLQHEGLIAENNIYAWPKLLKNIIKKHDLKSLGTINRKIYDSLFSLPVRVRKLRRIINDLLEA